MNEKWGEVFDVEIFGGWDACCMVGSIVFFNVECEVHGSICDVVVGWLGLHSLVVNILLHLCYVL